MPCSALSRPSFAAARWCALAKLTPRSRIAQFLEFWWEGNDLHATLAVLNTPAGAAIRNLCLAGERCDAAQRCVL
jgi:hypothetical protein